MKRKTKRTEACKFLISSSKQLQKGATSKQRRGLQNLDLINSRRLKVMRDLRPAQR